MTVHSKLLEVLVCPACKGPLSPVAAGPLAESEGETGESPSAGGSPVGLDCPACRLRYPIVDDIPVMLVDQATRIRA